MNSSGVRGVSYVGRANGHRRAYNAFLSALMGLDDLIEPNGLATAVKLIKSKRLLFSTMENDALFFWPISLARALLGRETAAIVMDVNTAFRGQYVRRLVKQAFFRIPRAIPKIHMISVLPFYLDQRFEKLANSWMYDPQFWDLAEMIEDGTLPSSRLAGSVREKAGRKPVVLLLGRQSEQKGFMFFCEILRSDPSLAELLQVVVAGTADAELRPQLDRVRESGGIVIDRYISDDELLSLSALATCLWSCYHPSYDMSSGVFGRAMQLGKLVCVREGSTIDRIAEHLEYPALRIAYGDCEGGARLLAAVGQEGDRDLSRMPKNIANFCRSESVGVLQRALQSAIR